LPSSSPVYAAGSALQLSVPLQFQASNIIVRFVVVYDTPEPARPAAVQEMTQLLAGGELCHHFGPRFPLELARQTHQAMEGGVIGKVTIEVAESH
jgi:NADPH:quinone reductase-like Zn-dependent oxidoreductase